MADEEEVVEEDMSPAQTPLVTLSFQKNDNRKQKYLEAEPKALGITQIALSLFNITSASVFMAQGIHHVTSEISFLISSLLVVIAGTVTIAAQNLRLPTLKACLVMQIVAGVASIFNMICTLVKMNDFPSVCWGYYYHNDTVHYVEPCRIINGIQMHFYSASAIIQAALFAVSVTLAAYCCKIVSCCAPALKMPVITVQAPPMHQ